LVEAYKDPGRPVEERVEDLLRRMTLEEKIGQMCQYSGFSRELEDLVKRGLVGSLLNVVGVEEVNRVQEIAVKESRLGIPLLLGLDVIHGYKTIFPIPLALASTWDPEVVRRAAEIAAREAAAEGIRWTFAPMVDIARDPRWGRIAEGFGEDPYLASVMAWAAVKGFQGDDLSSPDTILACAKHYVAYGAAEGGRDYNTVDISERTLREVYLPPFKAAVAAGVGTIMSAFNDLNGVPATANEYTLTTILRGEWGFQGFVVSDWNAIGELVVHGIAADGAEAAKLAVTAGVDMDMQGDVYRKHLLRLVREGVVPEERIDEAVRRILTLKFRLGLFENPYADPERARRVVKCREHLEYALEAARKAIVLVKNDGVLPLRKDLRRLAVIGPLADDREAPLGCWHCLGDPRDVVTVLEGIRRRVSPGTEVLYARGCDILSEDRSGFKEAVKAAEKADAVVLVVGESADMSGEAASRAYLDLPGVQEELVREVWSAVRGRGIPVVEVVMAGRPLAIKWSAEHIPAILIAWHLGVRAGDAIADVLFGDYNPGGRLPVTFPRSVGQVPIYYSHKRTGRPPSPERYTSKYIDEDYRPLFPFGHGLSYTRFEYRDLRVEPERVEPGDVVTISFTLINVGDREGDEVAQLYVRDVVASVTRPVKELKGFKRVHLMPGERCRITFKMPTQLLAFYGRDMRPIIEAGEYEVMIGSSSEDIRLKGRFEVTRTEPLRDLRRVWFTEVTVEPA